MCEDGTFRSSTAVAESCRTLALLGYWLLAGGDDVIHESPSHPEVTRFLVDSFELSEAYRRLLRRLYGWCQGKRGPIHGGLVPRGEGLVPGFCAIITDDNSSTE